MIEIVRWRDAWFEFDRSDTNSDRDDYIVETVGWVEEPNGPFLHIVSERLPEDDGHRAVTHVPVESIVERIALLQVLS